LGVLEVSTTSLLLVMLLLLLYFENVGLENVWNKGETKLSKVLWLERERTIKQHWKLEIKVYTRHIHNYVT